MKKLILLLLTCVALCQSAYAALIPEATAFPDANFRAYVKQLYPTCFSGAFFDDACTRVADATLLDVSFLNIRSLEGLQYFKKLQFLYCNNNLLTSLPPLPTTLIQLYAYNNQLLSLPTLHNGLKLIHFTGNRVSTLPPLPNTLEHFEGGNNSYGLLPELLPPSLKFLLCANVGLRTLPKFPDSIEELYIQANRLSELPTKLPNSLVNFDCENNRFTSLPTLPQSLKFLSCRSNLLTNLPTLHEGLIRINTEFNQLNSLPKLPSTLIELSCNNNLLTSLPDLSKSNLVVGRLVVQNNYLSFEDIAPNLPKFGKVADYAPQLLAISPSVQSLFYGSTFSMSVTVRGSGNTFQWFKNNVAISGATTNSYIKAGVTSADAGVYCCEVSNPLVPALKLTSNNVNMSLRGNAIAILSPKVSDFLQYNTYHPISITTNILDPVKIELIGLAEPLLITQLPASAAAFRWYVPSFIPRGSNYKIRVSGLGDTRLVEESEAFSIGIESPETRITTNFPASINDKSPTPLQISVEVGAVLRGAEVFCYYKPLSERRENFRTTSVRPSPTNPAVYVSQLPFTFFDKVGIEYYFEFRRNGLVQASSAIGITTIKYPNLEIPYTNFGKNTENYEIISIPLKLTQNTVNDIFKEELGAYDIKRWRTFAYRNGSTNEFAGGTVNAGEGFWTLIKDKPEMPMLTGEGTTIPTSAELNGMYAIPVKKGWNQIGNPYLFPLDFGNLQRANQALKVTNLQIFEKGAFKATSQLRPFQGGFVFIENDGDLKFPPAPFEANSGGRVEQEDFANTLDTDIWQVKMNLLSSTTKDVISQRDDIFKSIRQSNLGGFGMHPSASESKDRFDALTPPRFLEHLEINFLHQEYFYPYFSKDIVPTQESYVWEFSVESNTEGNYKTLSWDNEFFGTEKGLILFDIEKNIKIDMSKENTYTFELNEGKKNFKIYFGDEKFLKENILPEVATIVAYPNPFVDKIKLNISVPEKSKVYLHIFNSLGQIVHDEEREFEKGFCTWVLGNNRINASGVYFYQMQVESSKKIENFSGKLVKE
jgi:hypothetical protein